MRDTWKSVNNINNQFERYIKKEELSNKSFGNCSLLIDDLLEKSLA